MTQMQEPIGSGFGADSTAADVVRDVDLHGRVAIVTGGYSGLGLEAVRALRAAGADVFVPARDVERARAALDELGDVTVWPMDLMHPTSIDDYAERFLGNERPLHMLVNAAGIMANPLTRDARGFESQFSTNHLGHFQLAARLWPALASARGARVVQVSSLGHRYSPVVFEDPNFTRRDYDPYSAYGQSKTANILFALALDARGRDHDVRAFSLHPGTIVGTGLDKHVDRQILIDAGMLDADGTPVLDPTRQLKTPQQGAATIVWCATSPQLDGMGGLYCENCDVAPIAAPLDGPSTIAHGGRLSGLQAYAVDRDNADRLWSLSNDLLGLAFDLP